MSLFVKRDEITIGQEVRNDFAAILPTNRNSRTGHRDIPCGHDLTTGYRIDIPRLLKRLLHDIAPRCDGAELVPGLLWRIGKVSALGRSQEFVFAISANRDEHNLVRHAMSRSRHTVVLKPREIDAIAWSGILAQPVVSLEACVELVNSQPVINRDYLSSALPVDTARRPTPIRRAGKMAKLDALLGVVIDHNPEKSPLA